MNVRVPKVARMQPCTVTPNFPSCPCDLFSAIWRYSHRKNYSVLVCVCLGTVETKLFQALPVHQSSASGHGARLCATRSGRHVMDAPRHLISLWASIASLPFRKQSAALYVAQRFFKQFSSTKWHYVSIQRPMTSIIRIIPLLRCYSNT